MVILHGEHGDPSSHVIHCCQSLIQS